MFLFVLSHDGYIEMLATDERADKLRGALAPASLTDTLMPSHLYNRTDEDALMVDVTSALLASTKA